MSDRVGSAPIQEDIDLESASAFPREHAVIPPSQALLSEKCSLLIAMDREIADLEDRVKMKKSERNELATRTLPDLFDAANQRICGIPGESSVVEVTTKYPASITQSLPVETRHEAFNYLEELGGGDLIKTEVRVFFGRGEADLAREFVALVENSNRFGGREIEMKTDVHHLTLTKFVTDLVTRARETGSKLPDLQRLCAKAVRTAVVRKVR